MAMRRAAAPLTRTGRVVANSLIHLSVAPPPPPPRPARIAPSRPSSCGFGVRVRLGRSGVGKNMNTGCTGISSSISIPAGIQVENIVKLLDERLLEFESDAAEVLQKKQEQLLKMEQVIKSLGEKISREMKTMAVASKEILENPQNQERFLRRMKTEKWKKSFSALGAMNRICNIIFVVLGAALFWSRFHQEKVIH